jgi:hypothetical protein
MDENITVKNVYRVLLGSAFNLNETPSGDYIESFILASQERLDVLGLELPEDKWDSIEMLALLEKAYKLGQINPNIEVTFCREITHDEEISEHYSYDEEEEI